MSAPEPPTDALLGAHEGGLGVRDQIERYRTAFLAVVTMVALAVVVGGYILSQENFKLPGWVPVVGRSYFTLKARFQTAQAVAPGQGQAVTIAGAKIGEIASVDLDGGVASVTMKITPKYALIYHDATALLRPKTTLKDETVEIDPGEPSSGRLKSGETIPLAQTGPDANFDELLTGLDGDTRAYLQELLAGAGVGLKDNGRALAATLKRFDPTARDLQLISKELETRQADIASSIHNFRLLVEALGEKDTQLTALLSSSNKVFETFAKEGGSFESTLGLLPGALSKTEQGLGKISTAFNAVGPALKELHPFAKSLAPGERASIPLFKQTTPIFQNELRPFARQILPTVQAIGPDTKELAESFPQLTSTFSVLNEFFNELAYNPGKGEGGFLFFVDWASHNLNSVVSSADAHGTLGRSLLYLNCKVLPILKGVASINETVKVIIGLINVPTEADCARAGILEKTATAAATKGTAAAASTGVAASATAASSRAGAAGASSSGLLSTLESNLFGQASSAAVTAPAETASRGGG
jgi:phospholipid/cholesterol/gamma-HCH transport system substrate-binding protein